MTNSRPYYEMCCLWVELEARRKTGDLDPVEADRELRRLDYFMRREWSNARHRSLGDLFPDIERRIA